MDPANTALMQAAALAMVPVGTAFQWLRQYRSFPEWLFYGSGWILGAVWYIFLHYPWSSDWRLETMLAIAGATQNMFIFVGGTLPAAYAGNNGKKLLGLSPPATNSQP